MITFRFLPTMFKSVNIMCCVAALLILISCRAFIQIINKKKMVLTKAAEVRMTNGLKNYI